MAADQVLMRVAARLAFAPRRSRTVLWSGKANQVLADQFCKAFAGGHFETLEMYLEAHYPVFYRRLCATPWDKSGAVWYYLSARLAETASGDVRVFAAGVVNPEIDAGGPVELDNFKSEHKSTISKQTAYCNSVFEKIEGPALDANDNVENVLLMGRNINARPSKW